MIIALAANLVVVHSPAKAVSRGCRNKHTLSPSLLSRSNATSCPFDSSCRNTLASRYTRNGDVRIEFSCDTWEREVYAEECAIVLSACVAAYAHVAEEWHVRDGYALGTTLD